MEYSSTMSWLHCRVTFSLLCSAIQCIRGARSSCGHACKSPPPIDLSVYQALFFPLSPRESLGMMRLRKPNFAQTFVL